MALPKPMLTYHHLSHVAFIWWHYQYLKIPISKTRWKIAFLKLDPDLTGTSELSHSGQPMCYAMVLKVIIGSSCRLLPVWFEEIACTNADLVSVGPSSTISTNTHFLSRERFWKCHLFKFQLFCSGINVLMQNCTCILNISQSGATTGAWLSCYYKNNV